MVSMLDGTLVAPASPAPWQVKFADAYEKLFEGRIDPAAYGWGVAAMYTPLVKVLTRLDDAAVPEEQEKLRSTARQVIERMAVEVERVTKPAFRAVASRLASDLREFKQRLGAAVV